MDRSSVSSITAGLDLLQVTHNTGAFPFLQLLPGSEHQSF